MWGNDTIFRLIELYQSYEFLWDTSNKDYRNKVKKNNAWEDIAMTLQLSRKDVETKIHTLRSQFIREKKKITACKTTGSEDDIQPSTWFAYDAMKFLLKATPATSGTMDTQEMSETQERLWSSSEDENENERLSEAPSTPPPKLKRRKLTLQRLTSKSNFIQMPENMIEIPETLKMKDADYETLGKSIGIQLRDLNKKQLTITQKLISDAIYYAKMDMLTERSHIALEQKHELNPEMLSGSCAYQFMPFPDTKQSP